MKCLEGDRLRKIFVDLSLKKPHASHLHLAATLELTVFMSVCRDVVVVQSPASVDGCRRSSSMFACCRALARCFACCRRSCRLPTKRSGTYESVGADTASSTVPPAVQTPSLRSPAGASDEGGGALAAVRSRRTDWVAMDAAHGVESAYELERADRFTEASRIKVGYITVSLVNDVSMIDDRPTSVDAQRQLHYVCQSDRCVANQSVVSTAKHVS